MTFVLPVTGPDRKVWVPKAPAGFENSGTDWVAFHAALKGGDPFKKAPNYGNKACYAVIKPHYEKYDITCVPKQKRGVVSLEDAYTFFTYFTDCGVIPEGISLWADAKDDGIFCHIPKESANPHNIYAALSMYRWIDSHPPLVWQFCRIMEQDVKRHPLQVLPYLIWKHTGGWGHSFIKTSGMWGRKNEPENNPAFNPQLGVATKIYFDPEDKRGQKNYETPTKHVCEAIDEILNELSASVMIDNPKYGADNWAPAKIAAGKYTLEKPEDMLHPDLYELFTIPQITREQIEEILGRLFTKET